MMDASWIKREDTPKSVYNPLSVDFTTKYRDDNNIELDYKVRSMEIETFPAYLANHIIKHLIDAVRHYREVNSTDEEAVKKIREEIEVNEQ